MFLSFLRARIDVTKDTIFINQIEFDSIVIETTFFFFFSSSHTSTFQVLDKTTYCVPGMVDVFFFERNNADFAITGLQPLSSFSGALLLFCRGTWLIELVEK